MSPEDSRALGARIQELLRARRHDEAVAPLREWTGRHPTHAPGWNWLAICLERIGDPAGALECARRAHELAPDTAGLASLVDRLETAAVSVQAATPDATLVEPNGGSRAPVEATLVDGGRATATPADATLVDTGAAAEGAVQATLVDQPVTPTAGAAATLVDPAHGGTPGGDATLVEPHASAAGAIPATAVDDVPVASTPTEPGWAAGAVVEGRYEIRGSTRGGMGEVYFAHDRELGLDLAIKTPLPDALATAAGRARFLREAEAWVALGLHPNICTAYYVRTISGVPRLFIEYVDGGSLADWLGRHGEAPLLERLDLAIQIASGMDHAHTFAWHDEDGGEHHGLVHRDLKPANVLMGSDGRARVTDFGLVGRDVDGRAEEPEGPPTEPGTGAAGVETTLVDHGEARTAGSDVWGTMTVGGRVLGSPPYMAPEQWQGAHHAGRPADVYAFGCILYQLLCGRRPFELATRYADAAPEVQRLAWEHLHRDQAAPDPLSLAPDLDEQLARTVLACLAKEAGERPAGFAELGAALRAAYERISGRRYPRPAATAGDLLADSLTNRGVSFVSLEQRQRAAKAWREALASDPHHTHASFNLMLLQWQEGEVTDQEVANRLEEVRRSHQQEWRDELMAGRGLLVLGRYPEAAERLREAVAASGGEPAVARDCALAVCALATETGEPDLWREVRELLSRAGPALRTDATLLVCYALAAARSGDRERADRVWRAARQLDPELGADLEQASRLLLPGCTLRRRLDLRAGRLVAAAVDPDGRVAMVGAESGRIAVLDGVRGETVRSIQVKGGRLRAVAIVPHLGLGLSAADGAPVTVWNLTTGTTERTLQQHPGSLNGVAVTGDGASVAAVGSSGDVILWDTASGTRRSVCKAHSVYGLAVAVSRTGAVVASGGGDGTLTVVDGASGRVLASVQAHDDAVTAMAVDAEGRLVLTGGEDGRCHLWDLERRARVKTLSGHSGPVRMVALAADGSRALTASGAGGLRQWDLRTGRLDKAEALPDGPVAGAASTSWQAVLAAHGARISLYDLSEPSRYQPAWAVAHVVTVSQAADRAQEFGSLLEQSRQLAAAQDWATARIVLDRARSVAGYERAPAALEMAAEIAALFPRGALAGAWEEQVLGDHQGAVTAAAFAPRDARRVVTGGRDRTLRSWNVARGTGEGSHPCSAIPVAVSLLADGRTAVTADLDNAVQTLELGTGTVGHRLLGHEARIHAMAVDGDGLLAATASADGSVRVWDLADGTCRWVLEGHLGQASAVAMAPDGWHAVSGGDDGSLLLWDLRTGKSSGQLEGHGGRITDLDWSVEGRYVLSASRDGTARLWDAGSRRCLRTLDDGVSSPVRATLTPDSRYAAIAEASGAVGLWELRARQCLRTFEGHTASVTALALSDDGTRLLTASEDGSARLWRLDWEAEIRPFAEWDEAAAPHLEVFLTRHAGVQGTPQWSEADVRQLLADLRRRGLGWIRPDGVRTRLELLTERHVAEPDLAVPPTVRLGQRSTATPLARQQTRSRLWRVVAAVALGVPLTIGGRFAYRHWQLHLEAREARDLRARNLTVLMAPTVIARPADCERTKLDQYIHDYTEMTDSLRDWSAANYCLAELADPRSVPPILATAGTPEARPTPITGIQIGSDRTQIMGQLRKAMSGGLDARGAAVSLLARMGEPVVRKVVESLGSPDQRIRETAAFALALSGTSTAIAMLADRVHDPDVKVRRAVSGQLANLALSDKLTVEQSFELVETMASDEDPEVRRNAARSLALFAGRRTRALAKELAEDPDEEVRKEAARHLH